MLVPNRYASSSSYRYGFNGKQNDNEIMGEGNFQDYGMRMYNPRIGRFFNVDPLTTKYPMLTPFQFASNSPIAGIDLDGLEHYMVVDGQYLGKPANSTNEELRIVSKSDSQRNANNVDRIHKDAKVVYNTLPVYSYSLETKEVSKSSMTMQHFLDLAHIIYGENKGKDSDSYAHLLLNREIKMAKLADKVDGAATKSGPTTTKNSTLLFSIEKYGFTNAILAGTYMPNSKSALAKYDATLHTDGVQIDGGVQNKGYEDFFKLKTDVPKLILKIKPTQEIFKSIIGARLGTTNDPNEDYDGWRSDGPRKEISGNATPPR
jgi:RHS repeat-associated protein